MHVMRRSLLRLCGVALLVCGLLVSLPTAGSHVLAANPYQKTIDISYFSAKVLQGPDKGLSLAGTMHLTVDPSGSFTGTFVRANGPSLSVLGQISGHAFNVAILLGNQKAIFGSGTLVGGLSGGAAGGLFTGPADTDLGHWAVCIGVHTSDGTCYGINIGASK
jgi:hypothetical protein